ncbi:MAG TPA: sensor histidine kinase [Solirubrobacterales bacterium]|jgi:two-component system sensor histidine kinase UhpB|nr:sensor histidine kinase [Solirubrobacterales bacterium]
MRDRRLLTQVLIVNLMLVIAAVVGAILAANPNINFSEKPEAALVLGFAVALTVILNLYLVQRRFRPLEKLVDQMERADLSRPGANLRTDDLPVGPEEVERLHQAFRRMLERLEAERRRTSSAALEAQEEERARVARDLHDEVNQSLTGLLLRLEAAREKAPPELAQELTETKALANQAMQELLALARQLRPAALDDLGLKAAMAGYIKELGDQGGMRASFEAHGDFSDLPQDVQLVVYRVAQEALSNALRHASAENVRVALLREDGEVELRVGDDGRGFSFEQAARGLGIAGMRERALLVGGDLRVESRPELGTRVSLRVPIGVEDGGERGT